MLLQRRSRLKSALVCVISVSLQPQSGELLAEEDVDEGVVLAGVVGVDGDLDGGFGGEVVDGDASFVGA